MQPRTARGEALSATRRSERSWLLELGRSLQSLNTKDFEAFFRKLKKGNKLVAQKLLPCRGALAVLVAAGFPEDGVQVRQEGQGCAIIRASKAGKEGQALLAVLNESLIAQHPQLAGAAQIR